MRAIGQIPTQQPDRIVYSKNGGQRVVQEWKGPAFLMQGLVAQLRVAYDEVSIEERDGVATVRGMNRAPIGYEAEAPVVNFELISESQTLNLAHSGYFADLSNAEITAVENAFSDTKKTRAEKETVITAAGGGTLAKQLLTLKERGQHSFVDYSWAFTKTTTVSRYYPTTINLSDHGKLWTDAQVNAYVGTMPLITLPVKAATTGQQTNIGLDYRWFRYQSQVQFGGGNFNLVEGWRLALWNTNIYDAK